MPETPDTPRPDEPIARRQRERQKQRGLPDPGTHVGVTQIGATELSLQRLREPEGNAAALQLRLVRRAGNLHDWVGAEFPEAVQSWAPPCAEYAPEAAVKDCGGLPMRLRHHEYRTR